MKKILFVINTLGRAGAETALLELLRRLDAEEYEISLYVLLGQGEMISQVPQRVHVKNKKSCLCPYCIRQFRLYKGNGSGLLRKDGSDLYRFAGDAPSFSGILSGI